MNREQLQHLALAGTVTFPATFPGLATLSLEPVNVADDDRAGGVANDDHLLVATEYTSPKVTIRRKMLVSAVNAVFIPNHPQHVDLGDGRWLLKAEVAPGLCALLADKPHLRGIVFINEHAATILELSAGMTAAESSQYYPPLPCDRSVNHYDPVSGMNPVGWTAGESDAPESCSLHACAMAEPRLPIKALRAWQCSQLDMAEFLGPAQ